MSNLKRWFLTWASRQNSEGQSQCPEKRTRVEAKGRWGNECWNLYAFQNAVRNECLVGLYWKNIGVPKELDAEFNLAKIHLMSQWVEQIRWYGAIQSYSAERHEPAHITYLTDGWNAPNHNMNHLPQVFTLQRRILCFGIRELTLQAVTWGRENTAAAWKVPPSDVDLAAPNPLW